MQIHLFKANHDLLLNLRDVSLFFSDCKWQVSVSSSDLAVKLPLRGPGGVGMGWRWEWVGHRDNTVIPAALEPLI